MTNLVMTPRTTHDLPRQHRKAVRRQPHADDGDGAHRVHQSLPPGSFLAAYSKWCGDDVVDEAFERAASRLRKQ